MGAVEGHIDIPEINKIIWTVNMCPRERRLEECNDCYEEKQTRDEIIVIQH
jgi:hypothetical protein